MRIRSPSLHELHAFAATARLGSFSRAADELCVTQGGVSRAVARLEDHLGQPLLRRRGRITELTDAGRAYLDRIGPALQALESAALALAAGAQRRVRLSAPPTLTSAWLIPRLPRLRAAHPELALSFAPYLRDDPMDNADVDLWVRIGDQPAPAGWRCEYLVGREIVPICRPQDLAGPGALRTPQDLLRRPLLNHSNYPDNWRLWFEAQGIEPGELHFAAGFDQVAMLVQGVIAGLGLAVVQRCLIDQELAAGRIALPLAQPAAQPVSTGRGYHLCLPAQRADAPAVRRFSEWLLAEGRASEAA